jgi:hypothetical protein
MFFLRKSSLEQLPVAMSGVRMGERALQVGIADRSIAGAIAAKVGLSGSAAFAVTSEAKAAQARTAGANAGVLVDVHLTSLDTHLASPGYSSAAAGPSIHRPPSRR